MYKVASGILVQLYNLCTVSCNFEPLTYNSENSHWPKEYFKTFDWLMFKAEKSLIGPSKNGNNPFDLTSKDKD